MRFQALRFGLPMLRLGALVVSAPSAVLPAQVDSTGSATAVEPGILRPVQDRTQGIRDEERTAYYRILKQARDVDFSLQQATARENLNGRRSQFLQRRKADGPEFDIYLDMMRFPERYHGQLVTLEGVVRRLEATPAAENPFGLNTLFEARLLTHGSRSNLIWIVCTSVPAGMPAGQNIAERAAVTGYFFKLVAYQDEGDSRVVPMILAQRLEWELPEASSAAGLAAEVLAPIRQRTQGILDAERDSYYRALKHAKSVDRKRQKTAARKFLNRRRAESKYRQAPEKEFPLFADLFNNPEQYHGKPVTLRGHLRKLQTYPGASEYGIETLYEAWLYTENSHGHPFVVVCTSIPEAMEEHIGSDLVDHVVVTGYFFKLMGYQARDANRLAPLILAHHLEWYPAKASTLTREMLAALFVVVAAIVGFALMGFRKMTRQGAAFRRHRNDAEPSVPDFSQIESALGTGGINLGPPDDPTGSSTESAAGENPPSNPSIQL